MEAEARSEVYPVIAEGRSDLDQVAGGVNKVGEMASPRWPT